MSERIYIVWCKYGYATWRAYYRSWDLWIFGTIKGMFLLEVDGEYEYYPSLNLAKRAGSKWLRAHAKGPKAKPGGRRPK